MATFYLDLVNGNDANNGTSWALAWKTFTTGATAARIAPGDEIRVAKSSDPTSIGNATWTSRSSTVTLATAQTATIDNCETAWTAANTATVTRVTTSPIKQGTYAAQIVTPASTATSTLYAYFAVGGAGGLDLSAYQQITFWFYNATTAVADANRYQIKLCSDTAGATAVDTFNIPAIPSTARWVPITIAKTGGGNLGNAIKSIALYTGTSSPGNTQTIRLDNFSACTTSGLNLRSLISKNSGATWTANDGWWSLQYIDGTDVRLTYDTNTAVGSTTTAYYTEGTSPETVTTYIRPAIVSATLGSTSATVIETIQDSGTAGNLITFSGGWNTSNTTQDGMTLLDGLNGFGYYFTLSQSYVKLSNFGFTRLARATNGNSSNTTNTYENMYFTSMSNRCLETPDSFATVNNCFTISSAVGMTISSTNATISNIYVYGNNGTIFLSGNYQKGDGLYSANTTDIASAGFAYTGVYSQHKNITSKYNAIGVNAGGRFSTLSNLTINNCTTGFVEDGIFNVYNKISASTNTTLISSGNSLGQGSRIYNLSESGTSIFIGAFNTAGTQPRNLAIDYINGSASDSRFYTNVQSSTSTLYNVLQQTTVVKTAGGVATQVNVLNTSATSLLPVSFPIATIAVNANTAVTVKCWVKKSHATDIAANIIVRAYEIIGITADVIASKSNDTNWEELTVSFTPTSKGVINVYGQSWWVANAATQSVYFDDVTITQV